ncbi:hypothetical protein C5S39_08605, partial [Candidatus Methanophagaceae archaeon]
ERWMLYSVTDNPIRSWDSRGNTIRTTYDALQRPTHLFVRQGEDDVRLAEQTVYGEGHTDAESLNLRGEVYQQYDGAGVVTNEAFDFKGNLLRSTRQLLQDYKNPVNWSLSPVLEYETFASSTAYDALNRPIRLITPDGSETWHSYNDANLLEKVDMRLRGAVEWTPFVLNIDYDAKGQRVLIEYANGVRTTYEYDRLTFRLIHLQTRRTGDNVLLQDLSYTYDPVGNITRIQDDAQQTIFFRNQVVTPSAAYEYDALYRLIRAEGRELVGQNADHQRDHTELPYMPIPHANDSRAMRRYIEGYEYDEVGNILRMIHRADNANWTRRYQYALESNRLLSTSLPGDLDAPTYSANHEYTARYHYDAHGNMIRMPHLPEIKWDYEDQMQQADLGGGGTVYYVYDAGGERLRKVHEHNGSTLEERIYLGGFEIYRKRNGNGLTLEREALHIMDDEQRIALVETKTIDVDMASLSPAPITRYQINNHLGSSGLELDESGLIISYEEYYPFGSSSYHATKNGIDVSLKRYRYTGKERDDETGLYYYGARYYASWMGRWINCDPHGVKDGDNLYRYVQNNPIISIDKNGLAECDTSNVDTNKLRPSNYALNKVVNKSLSVIRKMLGIWPGSKITRKQKLALINAISFLGMPRGGSLRSSFKSAINFNAKYNKSFIEKYAKKNFPTKKPGGKYMGIISSEPWVRPLYGIAWGVGKTAVNPSVVIKTIKQRLAIGTDKLGHFFGQGYEYFDISVIQGKGDKAAFKYGKKTEMGKFGVQSTGVYSNADLEANKSGLMFYKDLFNNPLMKFDIAKYVNRKWNEELNPNTYSASVGY